MKWTEALTQFKEANFLQSPEWGKVNTLVGHQVVVETGDEYYCQMIVKNAKRGRYLEIPGGPLLDWQKSELVENVFRTIRQVARSKKCVFIRMRPGLLSSPENLALMRKLGAEPAPMHLHAEHTVILDLQKSEDELLKDMRRQTRYEVRRSAKLGLEVTWGNSEELFREFHAVQTETALRQHFVPPDLKMLLAEREAFGENARLYVAKTTEGQAVAYGLILISGQEAEYFEAASTELNHKLPGAYALQWQVIKDLKALSVARYNLWGIAPPGVTHHRYAGVTVFKTGFGGDIVEFVPAQDLVLSRTKYLPNLVVEKIRKKVRHL